MTLSPATLSVPLMPRTNSRRKLADLNGGRRKEHRRVLIIHQILGIKIA
jgi:hypothetical protein